MAASTASRIAALTLPSRFITRETVLNETPASRATSLIVGRRPLSIPPSRAGFDKRRRSSIPVRQRCPLLARNARGGCAMGSTERRIGRVLGLSGTHSALPERGRRRSRGFAADPSPHPVPQGERASYGHAALLAALCLLAPVPLSAQADPAERAAATEAQMTDDERIALTLGHLTSSMPGRPAPPPEARPGAGYIAGVPRLGVPALYETDASLGVTWIDGARGSGGTQLPSGVALGSTWNLNLVEQGGRMIGAEARAKGFNVMLAGGINLMREPRSGRTFEYFGEDPLHTGLLGGAAVRGIQSNNIISTLKHFAINPQETGRAFMNTVIAEDSLRESDLLAFEIAIEQGNPGAHMCAYNATNGAQSVGHCFLRPDVLRRNWGYRRFVMSDWGAVDAVDDALARLDEQSGSAIDPKPFFGEPLKELAPSDPAYAERLRVMANRVLWAIYD